MFTFLIIYYFRSAGNTVYNPKWYWFYQSLIKIQRKIVTILQSENTQLPLTTRCWLVWSKSAHRDIDLMCKRINIRWVKKSRKQLEVINMFFKHCHIMQGNINVVLLDRDLVEGIRRFTPYTFWTTPYTPVSISYILWWIPSDNSVSSVCLFFCDYITAAGKRYLHSSVEEDRSHEKVHLLYSDVQVVRRFISLLYNKHQFQGILFVHSPKHNTSTTCFCTIFGT